VVQRVFPGCSGYVTCSATQTRSPCRIGSESKRFGGACPILHFTSRLQWGVSSSGFELDHLLLRSWLALPPGPWPPDHYTLLGLPPGHCDLAALEVLVLARMDWIRPHQLLHPELVTEGMNRLAQALICLTDPAGRAAYDAEQELARSIPAANPGAALAIDPGLRPGSQTEPVFDFALPDESLPPEQPAADETQVIVVPFAAGLLPPEPSPPAYEVVEPEHPQPPPSATVSRVLPYEVVWEHDAALPAPSVPAAEVVEAEVVALPEVPWKPGTRRLLFARLAAIRRYLAAWRKLAPIMADPGEPLARPARALVFLEAVAEVRTLFTSLRGFVGELGRPGGLVVSVIRQPLLLHGFRLLLPDQRRAVALDWRQAEVVLVREYSRLRELVRTGRPVRRRSRPGWRLLRWSIRTPEVALFVLGLACVILALLLRLDGLSGTLFP
jgi:hypothetical protein